MKFCQLGNHEVSALWRAKGKTQLSGCKDCVGKEKAKDTTHKPVAFTSNSTAKKVYSTIAKVSDKKLVELAEYRKVRDKWLRENPFCEVCGTPYNLSVHHRAGRIGKLLSDIRFFMTVCTPHHKYIEEHPDWSKARGYSVTRLDKSA